MTTLRKGDRVQLNGLYSAPARMLNGAQAVIVGEPNEQGRFPVKILKPPDAVRQFPDGVRVKPENALLVQAAGSAHFSPEFGRWGVTRGVGNFLEALDNDLFPCEQTEATYGIKMPAQPEAGLTVQEMSMGNLMYSGWVGLRRALQELEVLEMGIENDDLVRGVGFRVKG